MALSLALIGVAALAAGGLVLRSATHRPGRRRGVPTPGTVVEVYGGLALASFGVTALIMALTTVGR